MLHVDLKKNDVALDFFHIPYPHNWELQSFICQLLTFLSKKKKQSLRLCSSCINWFLKLLLALIVSVVTALCLCEVVLLMDLSLASCSSTYVYLGISTCLSLLGRFVQHLLSAQHFSQNTSCNLIYQTVAPSRSKGGNPSSLCIWPPAPVRPNTLLWQMICWSVCTAYFITWI